MHFRNYLAAGAAGLALVPAIVSVAQAQETTGTVRGVVTAPDGMRVSGASVMITDTRTGNQRTTTTSPNGVFDTQNLNVGGPYTVEISSPDYQGARLEGVTVQLGETSTVALQFPGAASAAQDVIVVTASRTQLVQTAIGPSATFNLEDIQTSPAINRDLKDVIRQDPRIYLDESFADSIQCAGAHPRFNSLTVDGIALNDGFGLNSNGYPTERMPFPYDAISQVSVELAPFDVQYGGFTACNINAVTKSGQNEFFGSLFYDYTDDGLRGDSIEGDKIDVPSFDEKRYGFTVGGPIWRDHLFFFAAYEKFEGINLFERGPEGSGTANEVAGFSQADYDRVLNIAQNIYGYDPGGIPSSAPAEDEKYLIRLDWNITNDHRATFTYNYNDALNLSESDGDSDEFEYLNHLYNRGAKLEAYSGQIFSDWTDNLSTELRLAYNTVDFTQASVNGTDFAEVQINDDGNVIYLGSDDSRQANDLDYSTLSFKGAVNYSWNDHLFTAGYERLNYDIFNLFLQHVDGEYRFSSIDDFENGAFSRVYYGNAQGTNDPDDAAASFSYDINTAYLQDEFTLPMGAVVTAGLRYEWYSNDDVPNANANFLARNGYSNTENLDGKSLLQPRVGVSWDVNDQLNLRAGFGLYSGGNPNVWVSNSYSNDGITNIQVTLNNENVNNLTFVDDEDGQGRPFFGVPQVLYDQVANGTANSGVNAIDPDFEIPAEWKFAVGATYDLDVPNFGGLYTLTGDILYSKTKEGSRIVDATLEQIGTAPDGRPIYRSIDRSDPGCAVNPADASLCAGRAFNNDLILTNSDGGEQFVVSAAIQKDYDFGLGWSLAYAYVDAKDVTSMTSSVAFSNWTSIATDDINNPDEATSNYEIPHRFTASIGYEHAFFRDYLTRINLFGQLFQSRPYSFTFDGSSSDMFGDGQPYVHLLYVPLENDPTVSYAPGFDLSGFNAFVQEYDLERGSIAGRNAEDGDWNNKFDLRIEQEFLGLFQGHKSSAFLTVENLGNLLNDDWGVFNQAGFPQRASVVQADIDPATGNYVYQNFYDRDPESRVGDVSYWTIRVGLKYQF